MSLFTRTPPAPTAPYTLSLHDALPIFAVRAARALRARRRHQFRSAPLAHAPKLHVDDRRVRVVHDPALRQQPDPHPVRSEEHTSELQSRGHLVCRLLLAKKKPTRHTNT